MARRLKKDKIELLVECARMHYEDHCTKSQIADHLGVSVTHVKRLIDEALARGIVRISIVERRDFAQLENTLASKFSLRLARVAPSSADYERQKEMLGQVAAELFEELATPGSSIGIGGGGSLKAMVDAIPTYPRSIHIAPMALVGRGPLIEFVDAAFLAALLFYKSSPKARASVIGMLPPPKDKTARRVFKELVERSIPEVDAVLAQARNSSAAFVGLGGSEPVAELIPLLDRAGIAKTKLIEEKAAGGINYNYFDDAGEEIASLFRTVSIAQLKDMASRPDKTVVCIAGGPHKIPALEIALRSRIVNAVVIDEKTAIRLTGGMSSSTKMTVLDQKGGRT
ncbi:MAG: sugar-binding transcriptional regulator [Acidobacteria bacterium]|nr:sugar-binding transcriptional regulator [Acidobacteriota bacterium]